MSPFEVFLETKLALCQSEEWSTGLPYPQPIHLAHSFLERAEMHLGIRSVEGYGGKQTVTPILIDTETSPKAGHGGHF